MISFVVPAHNEEALLSRTLRSIRLAADALEPRASDCEIVVVDDASTDGTVRVAREHGARVVPVALRKIAAVRNTVTRAGSWRVSSC